MGLEILLNKLEKEQFGGKTLSTFCFSTRAESTP